MFIELINKINLLIPMDSMGLTIRYGSYKYERGEARLTS
jgi:hypothetical protein